MSDRPEVAVIMANYNCARFIRAAIQSVLAQTLTSWELIIVDDASSDDSVALAQQAANGDPRIKILTQPSNRGPGAARNRALELDTARWIAILDSDDLMPPHRLESLLRRATQAGASIVADNLLEFSSQTQPRSFLPARLNKEVCWISLDAFVGSNCLYSRTPPLGYLKPMIRADIVRDMDVRYDESLRIAEDYYFLVELMLHGYRLLLDPTSVYLYRKHPGSVSHRMRAADIAALIAAEDRFARRELAFSPRVTAALHRRRRSLYSLCVFDRLIAALKSGDFRVAAHCVATRPHAWPLLMQPLLGRLRKLKRPQKLLELSDDDVLRTIIVGQPNAYLSGF